MPPVSCCSPTPASPLVPPDHWAWAAARRLAAAGLGPRGFDRGKGFVTRADLGRLFLDAARRAEQERPALEPLADAYLARWTEEFGDPEAPATGLRNARGWLAGGYDRAAGRVRAGVGYFANDWTGARAVPDSGAAFLAGDAAVVWPHLALEVQPAMRASGPTIERAEVVLAWGPVGAWVGRRAAGFGPGEGGGIVLDDAVSFDGGGVFLQPVVLPSVLRLLGPIQIETFVSRVRGGDRIRDPYFIAFRGSMSPVPRLTVALNRAAMFGGEGNDPITLKNLSFLLVGGTRSGRVGEFANDVLSVDAEYRPPLGALPLVAYVEWGMDDSAGAWHKVPALLGGLELAALPGLPALALGIEATSFSHSCCGNTMWYRNWALRNGWTDDGVVVGHPLAGQGTELRLYGDAALSQARARLRGAAFVRDRGAENLLAPQRVGGSWGGEAELAVRARPDAELRLAGDAEWGRAGWRTGQLTAAVAWLY